MEHLPYGWKAKIGLIYIASAYATEAEFCRIAPVGVTTHTTRIALSDQPELFTIDDLSNLHPNALKAAKLLSQAPLDVIAFGCTSGSLVHGVGYDLALVNSMEQITSLPCTTTATAITVALRSFEVSKIAIATPYTEDVNQLTKHFFMDSGFHITNITGLGLNNDYKISALNSEEIYQLAVAANNDDAEALLIACTGLSAVHLVEKLERDLQKPVITSNQATFWHALRLSGVTDGIDGYGKLLQRKTL